MCARLHRAEIYPDMPDSRCLSAVPERGSRRFVERVPDFIIDEVLGKVATLIE